MSPELARAVFFVIWGGGLVVWALGLRHSLALLAREDPFREQWGEAGGDDEEDPARLRGEVTVRAPASAVRQELARRLAAAAGSTFVVEERAEGLELRNTLPPAFNRLGWANVAGAALRVSPAGMGLTRVAYELDLGPLRRRLGRIALTVVLAAGLPVLLGVGALVWWLVLPSEHPAVRWQVFQTAQVVHALWPPFMVTSRLRTNGRQARTSLEAVIRAAGGGLDD